METGQLFDTSAKKKSMKLVGVISCIIRVGGGGGEGKRRILRDIKINAKENLKSLKLELASYVSSASHSFQIDYVYSLHYLSFILVSCDCLNR